jgi:hypothetical protein
MGGRSASHKAKSGRNRAGGASPDWRWLRRDAEMSSFPRLTALARKSAIRSMGQSEHPSDPAQWAAMLQRAVEADLAGELFGIRQRQATHLGRELERIDDYFARYEHELVGRARRSAGKIKTARPAGGRAGRTRPHQTHPIISENMRDTSYECLIFNSRSITTESLSPTSRS